MSDRMTMAELVAAIRALPRFDCETGGCGDPECCGSYGTMEEGESGDWLRRDDVLELLDRAGLDTDTSARASTTEGDQ